MGGERLTPCSTIRTGRHPVPDYSDKEFCRQSRIDFGGRSTRGCASPVSDPPIKHIAETPMEPALAARIVAFAVDVLVEYVHVVPAEPRDFLLEASACMFHERGVAALPQLAMPLDRPCYPIANGFDHVLVHHFTIENASTRASAKCLRTNSCRYSTDLLFPLRLRLPTAMFLIAPMTKLQQQIPIEHWSLFSDFSSRPMSRLPPTALLSGYIPPR